MNASQVDDQAEKETKAERLARMRVGQQPDYIRRHHLFHRSDAPLYRTWIEDQQGQRGQYGKRRRNGKERIERRARSNEGEMLLRGIARNPY